jgi:hypothetical protein
MRWTVGIQKMTPQPKQLTLPIMLSQTMRVKEEVKKQIDQVQEAVDFEYLQKITASKHK